ncbi:nucleotide pyrophosphohydrolase [Candidatus Kaiserbacteria bacterium]|nr:nucleotide pyrophosphohydrolase [Candidatus Kaiserbacteria bacterium]
MFKEAQAKVDEWVQGYKKPYFEPLSQFARLAEEVGEVGRILNHKYGDKVKKDGEEPDELGAELADILFAVVCSANSHNLDLDIEFEKIIQKSKTRDVNRFDKK